MNAIVLAGGRGERLRPLTDTCPKPLLSVLDVPVMENTLFGLSKWGIREAVVTTCYQAEIVEHTLGERVRCVKLHYRREETPLGTLGAVKAAEDLLDDEFLVLSGDALFDLDLSLAIQAHRDSGALVTLVLTEADEVTEYGVVRRTPEGAIRSFLEKPDWSGVSSDLVNTGIYVCSKKLLERVESGRTLDFSRDLFPVLLNEAGALGCVSLSGYWCDIGSPAALYRCNLDALDGKVHLFAPLHGRFLGEGEAKSFVGEGVRILSGSQIHHSVIGAHSVLSASSVSDSVLFSSARLGMLSRISRSLCGARLTLEERAELLPRCVTGEGVKLCEGARSREGDVLGVGQVLKAQEGAFTQESMEHFGARFVKKGSLQSAFSDFLSFGTALGSFFGSVLVATDAAPAARAVASAAMQGITTAGADAFDLGEASLGLCRHAAATLNRALVRFDTEEDGAVSALVLDENGLCASQKTIHAFSRRLRDIDCRTQHAGQIVSVRKDLCASYTAALYTRLVRLNDLALSVEGLTEQDPLVLALLRRGARLLPDAALILRCTEGRLELSEREGNAVGEDEMRAWLLGAEEKTRSRLYVLSDLPQKLETRLSLAGVRLIYPEREYSSAYDETLRAGVCTDAPLYDAAMLVCLTLASAYKKEISPEELVETIRASLDPFATCRLHYTIASDRPARFLSRVWERAEESAGTPALSHRLGRCLLFPQRGRITILSQAANTECAKELCDFAMTTLKALEEEP